VRFTAGPFVVALAAATACASGDSSTVSAAVRDSAGVTIVENPAGGAAAWRLSAEPVLSIGAMEGDANYQLHRVNGAVRLSDGRVAVLNSGSQEVRYYDADGRHVRTTGRQGGGPGEFQGAFTLLRSGDSVVVFDTPMRRITVLSPDGSLARTLTLGSPSDGQFPRPVRMLPNGELLATNEEFLGGTPETGVRRNPIEVLAYDAQGSKGASYGNHAGSEMFMMVDGDAIFFTTPPFARATTVLADDARLVIASNDSYELRIYALGGADAGGPVLTRIVRRQHQHLPVTQADIAEAVRQRMDGITSEAGRQNIERQHAAIPHPATMAAFGLVRLGTDGTLWVGSARRPSDGVPRWTVFDQEGRMIGELTVPERFGILEAGEDYVLGRWRDELDVEYVQVYRLEKP
jgi:hypothetical protein